MVLIHVSLVLQLLSMQMILNFLPLPSEYASQLAASEELQADMKHLYDWSTKNGLSLNLSKRKAMHFGTSNVQNPVHLNGAVLDAVDTIKNIGIFLANSCTFDYHVSHIVSKSYTGCFWKTA